MVKTEGRFENQCYRNRQRWLQPDSITPTSELPTNRPESWSSLPTTPFLAS